jgi:branched-chain amino acid transport system substrate-binding protein
MSSFKQILAGHRLTWLAPLLSLIVLTAQCNASPPTPPLPTTPTGPAIQIAFLSPAAGELATFGRMMRNGSLMVFDEWNEQGGLRGHRIEWTVYDTNCQFEVARQAAEEAIDDGFKLLIGPLCSEAAIAAATVAESAQVLMISPTATHPLVTVDSQGQTRSTIFRASYVWAWQGKTAAQFAYDTLKVNKAALLFYPSDDYARLLAETFAQQFTTQGGEIVHQATYTPADTDFANTLTTISQAGAEVIYLPANASIANQVASQLSALDISNTSTAAQPNLTVLGSDSWESSELDLTTTAGSYFTTHFVLDDDRPIVHTWTEAYKSAYAIEPDPLAARGYDAAIILTAAIEQAGTFEPVAVAKALEQGTFEGVTGQITFDHQHNPIKPVPIVYIDHQSILFSTSIPP